MLGVENANEKRRISNRVQYDMNKVWLAQEFAITNAHVVSVRSTMRRQHTTWLGQMVLNTIHELRILPRLSQYSLRIPGITSNVGYEFCRPWYHSGMANGQSSFDVWYRVIKIGWCHVWRIRF
jgi:hypothetical protein